PPGPIPYGGPENRASIGKRFARALLIWLRPPGYAFGQFPSETGSGRAGLHFLAPSQDALLEKEAEAGGPNWPPPLDWAHNDPADGHPRGGLPPHHRGL